MHVFLRIAGDLRFWAWNVNLQLVKAKANLMNTTVNGDWWQPLAKSLTEWSFRLCFFMARP